MEDGDEVVFEVDGQTMDFNSETEVEDQKADMASESEEEENLMGGESQNNNATGCSQYERSRPSQEKEEDVILPQSETTHKNEEEERMQRFMDYIRKQGLVISRVIKTGK